jgi:hypothetical protein
MDGVFFVVAFLKKMSLIIIRIMVVSPYVFEYLSIKSSFDEIFALLLSIDTHFT